MNISNCTNCTFKNFNEQYSNPAFTQGTINSYSYDPTKDGSRLLLDVTIDDGFPLPPSNPNFSDCAGFNKHAGSNALTQPFQHAALFDANGLLNYSTPFSYFFVAAMNNQNSPRHVSVEVDPASYYPNVTMFNSLVSAAPKLVGLRIATYLPQIPTALGDAYTQQARLLAAGPSAVQQYIGDTSMIMISSSNGVSFDNVRMYSTFKMAVHALDNAGHLSFNNMAITPQGIQLVGDLSDGLHLFDTRGPVSITNSYFGTGLDDAINVSSTGMSVTSPQSAPPAANTTFTVIRGNPGYGWSVNPRDLIQVVGASGTLYGDFTVASATPIYSQKVLTSYEVTFTKPVPTDCNAETNCTFFNLMASHPGGSVISQNIFYNRLRDAIVSSGSVKIIGNWIERLDAGVLVIGNVNSSAPGTGIIGPFATGTYGQASPIQANVMLNIRDYPLQTLTGFVPPHADNPLKISGLGVECNILQSSDQNISNGPVRGPVNLSSASGGYYSFNYALQGSSVETGTPGTPLETAADTGFRLGQVPSGVPWCSDHFSSYFDYFATKGWTSRNAYKHLPSN